MTPADREYLLRTVLGEAARQPEAGQAAVAHVILNRLKGGRYGDTVGSVVRAKSQFEPWGSREGVQRMMGYKPGDPAYDAASRVVDGVLSGSIPDPTGGADHFLNEAIVRQRRGGELPGWVKPMAHTAHRIGDHTFFGGSGADTLAGGAAEDKPHSPYLAAGLKEGAADKPYSPYLAQAFKDKPAEAPEPVNEGPADPAGGTLRAIQDGFFLGYGDNVGAAIGALGGVDPETGEWGQYSDSTFGERYQGNLAAERRKRGEFAENNPIFDPLLKGAGAVGSVALAAPLTGIKTATTTAGKVGQAMGGGGLVGAVAGSGEADDPDESRVMGAGLGAGMGAVGGLAGIPLSYLASKAASTFGKAVARVFRPGKNFDPATGQITEQGRRQLQNLGVDPDNVSRQLAEAYQAEAKAATGGDITRTAPAQSFGIPQTRGQATGDVTQIAEEEAMRAGARGRGAYEELRRFGDEQTAAVDAARRGLVPNPADIDAVDAAEAVQPAVRQAADAAKAAGRAAYDVFEEMGGGIKGGAIRTLDRRLGQALAQEALEVDAGLTNTSGALKILQKQFEGSERGAVPFQNIERARQAIVRLRNAASRGSNGQDAAAMNVIGREFDDWLETAVDAAISDGSGEAIEQVKKARGLWRDYASTFLGKKGADNLVRKMVEDELAPDQIAGWLFGASRNIGGGQSSLLAKKLRGILGAGSPEFQMLRQAAWQRLTMRGDTMRGPDDMAEALREFTSGKGRTLAAELFSPEEITRINEFRAAVNTLRVPQKAANRSGSGYEGARAMQSLFRAASAAIGFAQGGPGGAVAAGMAPQMLGEFSKTLAARAATKGITGPAPSLGGSVAGSATAAAQVSDRIN